MKSMQEISKIGYASVAYALKHLGHYSNGELSTLCGDGKDETTVYFSYVWYDPPGEEEKFEVKEKGKSALKRLPSKVHHHVRNLMDPDIGEKKSHLSAQERLRLFKENIATPPKFHIMLAKGKFKDKKFTACKTDGTDFDEADYEEFLRYNSEPNKWFRSVSEEEFEKVVTDVKTIYSCGGVTFLTVQALSIWFYDAQGKALPTINSYGVSIMQQIKEGNVVYIGQSAGTVAIAVCLNKGLGGRGSVRCPNFGRSFLGRFLQLKAHLTEFLNIYKIKVFAPIFAGFLFHMVFQLLQPCYSVWKPRKALLQRTTRARNNAPANRQTNCTDKAGPGRRGEGGYRVPFSAPLQISNLQFLILVLVSDVTTSGTKTI